MKIQYVPNGLWNASLEGHKLWCWSYDIGYTYKERNYTEWPLENYRDAVEKFLERTLSNDSKVYGPDRLYDLKITIRDLGVAIAPENEEFSQIVAGMWSGETPVSIMYDWLEDHYDVVATS